MGLTDYTISDKKYYIAGREHEREAILNYIQSRIDDFKLSSKDDCCPSHIYVLTGMLLDIKDGQFPGARK